MSPPPNRTNRRTHRLLLIAGVFALIVLGIVGLWLYRSSQDRQAQGDLRAEGLEAFEAQEYDVALAKLEPYVQRHTEDAEALYALARARMQVPDPQNRQLAMGAQYLRQTIAADPTQLDAAHELLDLYLLQPRSLENEILTLSEQVLDESPQDEKALRGRAVALNLLGRHNEAMQAAEAYLKVRPGDVEMQRMALEVMRAMNQPMPALYARVEALRKANPDDPRYEYLEAYLAFLDRDRAEAQKWLESAALRPPPDGAFAGQLVRLMDAARMFPQALAYLQKNVGEQSDLGLKLELARREFERGNLEAAQDSLAKLNDDEASAGLALRAVALFEMKRRDEAAAVLDTLRDRDFAAAGPWADFLATAYAPDNEPPKVIEAGAPLRELGVRDPYTSFLIGRAQEQAGDFDSADAAYKAAAELRPSWASPRAGMARLAMRKGDKQAAAANAIAAALRRPDDVETQVLSLVALGMDSANLDDDRIEQLNQLIDQVQSAYPGEPRTLLLRVKLLAEVGKKDESLVAARRLLDARPVMQAPVLLNLASLSREYGLGVDQEVYDLVRSEYGQTPDIALARAVDLSQTADAAEALALFDQLAGGADSLAWQTARAQLLERLGRPEAGARWAELADRNPQDLDVQRAALKSQALWQDRDAVKRIIERVREQSATGDDRWRVEMARFLLTGPDRVASAAEADVLLEAYLRNNPPSGQALTLRGTAKQYLKQPDIAVQLLQRAVSLEPTNPRIRLELARAFALSGSRDKAADQTRQALTAEGLDADETRFAVQLLVSQGQAAEAIQPMERLFERGEASQQDLYGLAELYLQTGQNEKVRAVLPRLLENPDQTAVLAAANLYGRLGEQQKAKESLDKLEGLGLPEADVKSLRGIFLARFGDAEAALAAFTDATELAPSDAVKWRNLVEIHLRMNQLSEAIDAARRGLQAVPDDPALRAVADHAEQVQRLGSDSGLLPLFTALVGDDASRTASLETLAVIDQARQRNLPGPELARRLSELSTRYPRFEAVRLLEITALYQTGEKDEAVRQAEAAANDFADSAAAARLAAETLLDTQQWSRALLAAEQWKQRDPVNAALADTLIAVAQGQLGRPERGVETLEPYRSTITTDPDRYPRLTQQYARLNAQAGRVGAARDVLDPLMSKSGQWRLMALDIASSAVDDTTAAAAWMDDVAAAIPQRATGEQTALAHAWWTLGKRAKQQAYIERAKAVLNADTLAAAGDANMYFLRGMIAESEQDWPAAEDAYRQVFRADAGSAGARNNLAMVLAQSDPPQLEEAIGLAEDATRMVPNEPNYYDTLAQVQARAGRFDAAADSIRRAIDLDPTNPQWRVRLNEINRQRQVQ